MKKRETISKNQNEMKYETSTKRNEPTVNHMNPSRVSSQIDRGVVKTFAH